MDASIMKYSLLTNPRTTNVNTHIDCDVTLEDGSVIPFTSAPDADTEYGIEIYKKLKTGKFGKVNKAPQSGGIYFWDRDAWTLFKTAEAVAVEQAEKVKSDRLSEAGQVLGVLSDAVDLGIATDEEKHRFDEWRKYRVVVSRVDTASPDIAWPEVPQ